MNYSSSKEFKRKRSKQKIRARNRVRYWRKVLGSSLRKIDILFCKAKLASDMVEKHKENYQSIRYRAGLPPEQL